MTTTACGCSDSCGAFLVLIKWITKRGERLLVDEQKVTKYTCKSLLTTICNSNPATASITIQMVEADNNEYRYNLQSKDHKSFHFHLNRPASYPAEITTGDLVRPARKLSCDNSFLWYSCLTNSATEKPWDRGGYGNIIRDVFIISIKSLLSFCEFILHLLWHECWWYNSLGLLPNWNVSHRNAWSSHSAPTRTLR